MRYIFSFFCVFREKMKKVLFFLLFLRQLSALIITKGKDLYYAKDKLSIQGV